MPLLQFGQFQVVTSVSALIASKSSLHTSLSMILSMTLRMLVAWLFATSARPGKVRGTPQRTVIWSSRKRRVNPGENQLETSRRRCDLEMVERRRTCARQQLGNQGRSWNKSPKTEMMQQMTRLERHPIKAGSRRAVVCRSTHR